MRDWLDIMRNMLTITTISCKLKIWVTWIRQDTILGDDRHLILGIIFKNNLYHEFSRCHYYSGYVCSVLFCSVLFCSVLFCSVLFCSVLFCSVLSRTSLLMPIILYWPKTLPKLWKDFFLNWVRTWGSSMCVQKRSKIQQLWQDNLLLFKFVPR